MVKESIATDVNSLEGLAPVLERARRRALDIGRPVLASHTVALAADTPVSTDGFAHCMRWEQPEKGFSLVALGETSRFTAAGPGRFDAMRKGLDALLADAVIERETEVSASLPVCVSGFAFDQTPSTAPEWRTFPDALAVVPRFLFVTNDQGRFLTLNVMVDGASDIASVALQLAREVSDLATPGRSSSREETGGELSIISEDALSTWREDVLDLTRRISAGEVDKVVLARRLAVAAQRPFNVDSVLARLRWRYPGCTVFAVRSGDACFLGATPELLVRLDDGRVRADSLAGSAARGANDAEDVAIGSALLADDKERREHAMVTRGLLDALQDVCSRLDVPATPRLRKMANVQHLHTPIEGRTDGTRHILELVERLHPTPATGGLPRERALCLIREHESFDRGWYAGPIGWIDARGGGEFAVALRSAVVEGDRAYLYAGCGIVEGSESEREYEESRMKLEAMLWALSAKDAEAGKPRLRQE